MDKGRDSTAIRRQILRELYSVRKSGSREALTPSELTQLLHLSSRDLRFNLEYLTEKGLVKLVQPSAGSRGFNFAEITALGIDLVDDPSEFNRWFPSKVLIQNILGDKLDITVGDFASHVTLGKNIVHTVELGADIKSIPEICTKFRNMFQGNDQSNPILDIEDQLNRLAQILAQEEPDLGEIQRIKHALAEFEGRPAIRTSVLFSHPMISARIQQVIDRLVGREGSISDD